MFLVNDNLLYPVRAGAYQLDQLEIISSVMHMRHYSHLPKASIIVSQTFMATKRKSEAPVCSEKENKLTLEKRRQWQKVKAKTSCNPQNFIPWKLQI